MPKRAEPKPPAGGDAGLWQRAMRDVRRLAPHPPPAAPAPPAVGPARRPEPAPSPSAAAAQPEIALDRFAGIDRANAERLKRGKQRIEARLDLHGMTQEEAHRALARFIRVARGEGKRCVLVVTGRGRLGGGVLRAAVPRWLNEPGFRPHLLAIASAQPQDGGAGALYVMLRRNATVTDR